MVLQWRRWGCLLLAILGVSAACPLVFGSETSKVMGDIEVAAGEHTGDLSTVNGSIHVHANAVVGSAHAVNGSISLDAHAHASELTSINGQIELGQQAKVSGKVHTVNGKLTLAEGAEVGGSLENVNGAIRVAAAHVGGGIETVSGNMELGPRAHIDGGLRVHKAGGFFGSDAEDVPRIVIAPGSIVGGTLEFERPVKLYVSDKATIGPVQGTTAVRFSGDAPLEM